MSTYSKELPLNPDGSLGTVIIGSKLRPQGAKVTEPLPLAGGKVEIVEGCGWSASTAVISEPELVEDSKWLKIRAGIASEIPVAHYVGVMLGRKPMILKVSAFPKVSLPGMGVPVPVAAAPVIDDVSVTIPPLKRPEINLEAQFMERDVNGAYRMKILATVDLPPYVSKVEKSTELKMMAIAITEAKDAKVTRGAETPLDNGKEIELVALPVFASKDGPPSMTITATVSLAGLDLRADKRLTLDVERKYLLNVSPATLGVTVKTPASLTVQVLEEMPGGQKLLVADAAIKVSGGEGLVSLAPSEGEGRLSCTVTQPKITDEKKTALTVSASAGRDKMPPQTVPVVLETAGGGTLEVVFDPPEKTSLNPFVKADQVILRARVVPEKEGVIVPAVITFEPENPEGWLDGPREFGSTSAPPGNVAAPTADISTPLPVSDGEWTMVAFFGKVPAGLVDALPPASEQVIIRAAINGQTIDERPVPIGLQPKPSVVADKTSLSFLANASKERSGRPPAPSSDAINFSIVNHGGEDWKFTLKSESDLVTVEEKEHQSSASTFEFIPKDNLPPPPIEHGKPPWEQVIEFAVTANSSCGLEVEGPQIAVTLSHEGIYIDRLVACDESGNFHDVTAKGALPYRVFSPDEERAFSGHVNLMGQELLLPYAMLSVMVWNGSGLERKEDLSIEAVPGAEQYTKAQKSKDADTMAAKIWDFLLFTLHDSILDVIHSGEDVLRKNTGKWHVILLKGISEKEQKEIPGKGEVAKGHISFAVGLPDTGLYPDFQCDVPIHLQLGKLDEAGAGSSIYIEGARCRKIIDGCFPAEDREKLWLDLEMLPEKCSKDYRDFAKLLYDRAWSIWARDQKDFLFWDNGWGTWLYWGAEKAKWAGDVSFMLLVGYATSELGAVNAYFASELANACKNEGLEFYVYYLDHKNQAPFKQCVVDFVHENLCGYLLNLSAGAVDMAILHGFDLKNPATYRRLAWLWLWKFEQQLARNPEAGYVDAMVEAGKEVVQVPVMMLLQEFVNAHGKKNLGDFWRTKVKPEESKGTSTKDEKGPAKGAKDNKKPGKESPGEKSKSEKAADKKQYDKEKKGQKDKAKGEAERAIKDSKGEGPAFERKAFEEGRAEGRKKLQELNKAAEELAKNPNDSDARRKFAEAAEKVQQDKHAMHELNNQNADKPDLTREQFNEFWKGKYERVDRSAKERIAEELNHNLKKGEKPYTADDIELAAVTNTPPKSPTEDSVKSTYDRDVTYRDKRTGQDIKSEISERIYNEEFFKQMHQGRPPASPEEAREFAEKCDQTVTDRFHKDAYGGGKVDIPPAVDPYYKGQPFKDVGATAKAMEYKVQEWYQRAEHATNRGDHAAAAAYKEEGMRQLTKQFKNQVEARVDKINEITGYPNPPTAKVPENLRAAVEVMNKVGSTQENGRLFTPADAEAALNKMGTSPKKVISEMSGVVESLQRNAPPGVRDAVEKHVSGLTDEAAAAFRAKQAQASLKQSLKSKHPGG